MKRLISVLLLVGAFALTGCEMMGGGDSGTTDDGSNNNNAGENPPAGGGMDLATIIQVPGNYPGMLPKNAQKGYMVKKWTKTAAGESESWTAIVNETDSVWHIESNEMLMNYVAMNADAKNMIIGMVVEKETGKVTNAYLGKEGETPKELKVMAYNEPQKGEKPETTTEEVNLPFGETVTCEKFEMNGTTSWSGTGQGYEGYPIKMTSQHMSYELKEPPSESTMDLGGVSVNVITLTYDNGMVYWLSTNNDVIAAFWPWGENTGKGLFGNKMEGYEFKATGVATDAAAKLKWPG